jgi:osmotically-inducible protein OsmY
MKAIVSLCLTIVFFTFLNGCKPNDEKVTAAVNKTLSANTSLSQVNASVKDGMVTLTGEVETDEQRSLAESSVAGVKGVKGVTNSITVKPQGPTAVELNRASDDALLSKVNENFATYKVDGITATVNGGVVTLTGEISRDNLQNAMKAAMEAGAVKVENQMTIK